MIFNGRNLIHTKIAIILDQSSLISFLQCLIPFCHISGVNFKRDSFHRFATLSFDEGCEFMLL